MRILAMIAIAALSLGASAGFAQSQEDPEPAFGALAEQADDPVNISAENLEVVEDSNTALFTGDVVIVQGTMQMTAQRVEVLYGEGGLSDLVNFVASGGRVVMITEDQTIEGNEATYDFADRTLIFVGDVEVINASGTITAQRLVIDTRAGTSSFSSAPGSGRVTGIFAPGG